jgi:predicted RNA binding protein YcfA (HicA-like mRNA interferase family)
MGSIETRTRKILARLEMDGWVVEHGKEHDICRHPAFVGVRFAVPRRRKVPIGVARSPAAVPAHRIVPYQVAGSLLTPFARNSGVRTCGTESASRCGLRGLEEVVDRSERFAWGFLLRDVA